MMANSMQPAEPRWGPPDAGPPDDVDRAFARLTHLPPPRDFAAGVMLAVQQVRGYQLGPRQVAWALAEIAAVLVLAVLAYVTGQAVVGGGTLDLLRAIASDAEVVRLLPGDTLLTLLESFPWIELLGVVAMGFVVVACTGRFGRALSEPPEATTRGTAGGAA